MNNPGLMALSPLDGRYREKVASLQPLFSEFGLIRLRVRVEVEWLLMLATHAGLPECPSPSPRARETLQQLVDNFSEEDAARVKHIESGIKHDVKAVEYFIRERTGGNAELAHLREFIHFGCTSEDINNLATGLMLLTARQQFLLPAIDDIMVSLTRLSHAHAAQPMLARTHGQAATPTSLGKEMANVCARLRRQTQQLVAQPVLGKLNGASGNHNALAFACPETDWQLFGKNFVTSLGLEWNPYTTQIEPHDAMSEYFSILVRTNVILTDFCRDMWGYIAIGYFRQKKQGNEVGSSIMPHKINPIDFENAEGNLGLANALLEHMILKLPISRWQRDLSDSTVLRNIGVAIGHTLLAMQSIAQGLERVEPDPAKLNSDLENHWEVLAEPIQTLMRRHGIHGAYEQLKQYTQGRQLDQQAVQNLVQTLLLPAAAKEKLLQLTPFHYTGYAEDLAKRI